MSCRPALVLKPALVAAVLLSGPQLASAASVTLNASDAVGSSSFNSAGHWNNSLPPANANAYFTGAFVLRTPANALPYAFAGNSLSIDAGGRFLLKTTGTAQVITVTNLILNGGNFEQATANSDSFINTVAGNITVNAASGFGALGGTTSPSSVFETLNLTAAIAGSAPLQLGGSLVNTGQDSGLVKLSAANPYGGVLTVSNAIIASSVNGLLQLNNLNALSNATLVLNTSLANPISFAAAVNTAPFNLGALAGPASQVLADTAGAPVTLSVGGNNLSTACAGALTGPGALVKTGSGTLTLSGANAFSGGTTVAAGTLQTSSLWGAFSGAGTVVLMAPTTQSAQSIATAATPFSGPWIVASGWLAGLPTGPLGTNSILVDPDYALDPSAGNPPLAGAALFEPRYDLNSAGSLTLTNGGQMLLHQTCAFSAVTIEGVSLTNGLYPYTNLAAAFPLNFPAGGAGLIAVQPFGALPAPPAQAPQFLSQPAPQSSFTGLTVQFAASVFGSPAPSFQWQCASPGGAYTNLLNGGQFTGATSATLTITNLTLANSANYLLIASNASGSVTSSPASLSVVSGPPVITNALGVSVSIQPAGVYTIASTQPAWTFSGSLAQMPSNLVAVAGADAMGGYSELQFAYAASATHAAAIRLYTNQSVVLFSDTTLAPGLNDLAFPHLTSFPSNLYHVGFSGEFAPYTFSQLASDSPWIFFDTNFNSFALSPATNFMIASDVQNADGSLACGINSAISQLPAGFTHRSLLTIQQGINQAFDAWGNALTGLSGKTRPANDSAVELNRLGYWTDNGASYYYTYSAALGYTGTLLAIRDQFATNGFPLGYFQLDSWWYDKGVADTWQGDATNNRGGLDIYGPDPTLFPSGLATFQQDLGLPLLTHCRWIDGASPYRSQYAMSANVIIDPSYWSNRMAFLKASGVMTFEHDWLDVMALPLMNLTDPPAFMNQMAAAAASNGLNLQYCMELPRHYLQSSLYSNLVTLRVSIDRFEISKWNNFLYSSRLANAVGAWPWSDVYPSSETRNLLLGTLSAGPVGVGDALGALSTQNLAQAVRPDGVIVKPDVALAPIDQTYLNDAQGPNSPMVAATHVDHDGLRALYVFAFARVSANTNASFAPAQLGIAGPAYVYDYFLHTGALVSAGSPVNFATTLSDNVNGGSFKIAVPVGPSGIALVGDTNKFVTLGQKRVAALADAGVLRATVVFAAGETNVSLFGYAPAAPFAWALGGSVGPVNYDPAHQVFSVTVAPGSSSSPVLALSLSPPPFLQITNLGGAVQIFWPVAATGYSLESAPALGAPGAGTTWLPATNPITVSGLWNTVNLTPSAQTLFYRLRQ